MKKSNAEAIKFIFRIIKKNNMRLIKTKGKTLFYQLFRHQLKLSQI